MEMKSEMMHGWNMSDGPILYSEKYGGQFKHELCRCLAKYNVGHSKCRVKKLVKKSFKPSPPTITIYTITIQSHTKRLVDGPTCK